MTSYSLRQESGTSASGAATINSLLIKPMLYAGIIAAPLLPHAALFNKAYSINETPKTFGQLSSPFSGAFENSTADFEDVVATFYASLLNNQQPLGKEFEDVLNANLWDLYIRS